jgi:hypothetical protein
MPAAAWIDDRLTPLAAMNRSIFWVISISGPGGAGVIGVFMTSLYVIVRSHVNLKSDAIFTECAWVYLLR